MSYIFTFTPKESFNSKEMMEELSSQKDVQTLLTGWKDKEVTVEMKLSVSVPEKQKLYSFYHRVILGIAMEYYRACGYHEADKVFCDYQLKAQCGKDIMYNHKTGEEEVFLLDKSRMNKKRLHQFVTDCISFLEIDCGYIVPDSASFIAEIQTGMKGFKSTNSKKID